MKLVINKNILNEKLNIVSKAISSKNIVPVLSGIKFDLKTEGLFLTASNDEITIETNIDKKDIIKIEETGSIVVPGKYFLDIIRKIDDDKITIETDGLKINISTRKGEYLLNGMNSTDFPNVKLELMNNPIILKQQILKNMINETCFAVSTQESRPVLTGLNIKINDNVLECTATDSYRLARKTLFLDEALTEKINIVIPGRNLIELTKILTDDEENIELHIFSNNILFKTEDIQFQSRLLNNTYPDTSNLIPSEFELTIKVNLIDFYSTIDRVSLLTSEKEKNQIKMDIQDNNLNISCISQEIGKMEENLEITKDNNVNMMIAYSSRYMMEALKTFKCEEVEVKLNGEIKPIIIKNTEDENLIQLVLPIKTF